MADFAPLPSAQSKKTEQSAGKIEVTALFVDACRRVMSSEGQRRLLVLDGPKANNCRAILAGLSAAGLLGWS